MDGKPCPFQLPFIADRAGKAILLRTVGTRQLHVGEGTDGRGRSFIYQFWWPRSRYRCFQRAAESQRSQGGAWPSGVRSQTSPCGQLRLRTALGAQPALGPVVEWDHRSAARELAGIRNPRGSEWTAADGDCQRDDGSESGQRSDKPPEPRWRP